MGKLLKEPNSCFQIVVIKEFQRIDLQRTFMVPDSLSPQLLHQPFKLVKS